MSDWKDPYEEMPGTERVVLIHIRGLDAHGVVSAWWCVEDEPNWVALDDAVNYELDEVDFWREMIDLPEGSKADVDIDKPRIKKPYYLDCKTEKGVTRIYLLADL